MRLVGSRCEPGARRWHCPASERNPQRERSTRLLEPCSPTAEATAAQGFDGIRFARTTNQELFDEISALIVAQKAEKDPGDCAELGEEIKSLRKLLDSWGSSTEFDGHDVWIAFEPGQIKSAIGNSGAFDGGKPSIVENIRRETRRPQSAMP